VAKIPAIVSERKKVRTSIKLAGSAQMQESTPIVRDHSANHLQTPTIVHLLYFEE
jgi:hypothetical protein